MKLQKKSEWRLYAEDKAAGEKCEFLLEQVAPSKAERIYRECYGDSIEVRQRKGERVTTYEFEASKKQATLLAIEALKDSRGYEHLVGSDAQVKAIEKAVRELVGPVLAPEGEPVPARAVAVRVGEYVVLDGLWTKEVKETVLAETALVTNWVNSELGSLNTQASSEGKD